MEESKGDTMEYQQFVDRLFELGKAEGFNDMEVYYQQDKSFETTVFNQDVDKFNISEVAGLSFRGLYNEKMGYAYTELLDESSLKMLVEEAKANAQAIESSDKVEIALPQEGYQEVESFNEGLYDYSKADKIEFLKLMEEEAKALDDRIQSLSYNLYLEQEQSIKINNTKGMDLNFKMNTGICYVVALASSEGQNKTGFELLIDKDFKNYNYKEMAKRVVEKTVSQFGAEPVVSKAYPVVFKNDCAASLLGSFQSVFNAEVVQKIYHL